MICLNERVYWQQRNCLPCLRTYTGVLCYPQHPKRLGLPQEVWALKPNPRTDPRLWGFFLADTCAMSHEPRLNHVLRALLRAQRVAALGTLSEDGLPFVSMVPFAIEPHSGQVVIHVSGLAAHTRNLQQFSAVSLLVMQAEQADAPVLGLQRVTLEGTAAVLEQDSALWHAARASYLARFADALPLTALGDFVFVGIDVTAARQVAGFGAARSLDAEAITALLRGS